MDTMQAQLHNVSADANDVFSLSDQVLSERVEFVQEVRCNSLHGALLSLTVRACRLAVETGEASGYADPNYHLPGLLRRTSNWGKSWQLKSYIERRPQRPPLVSDHCALTSPSFESFY